MVSTTQRIKAFNTIDKDGNGVINFKEWYRRFKRLVKKTNMEAADLAMMFHAYDETGSSRGIDLTEYTSFMNDVFGPAIDTTSTTGRQEAFAIIDKNNSGLINFKEWYSHFKKLTRHTNINKSELAMMFNAYDEAGSSRGVDIHEYTSFMNDVFGAIVDTESNTGRQQSFKVIDKNGSGTINFREWHTHFKGLLAQTNMNEEELQMMFNAYDEAGSSLGIDSTEYTSFMNDVFGKVVDVSSNAGRAEAFDAIDKNVSGVISFKEWYKHFKGLVKQTNMNSNELYQMFSAYDEAGSSLGIDRTEYTSFMNDVFGASVA